MEIYEALPKVQSLTKIKRRRSLVGYSGRFIPGRSLVRIRSPLPLSILAVASRIFVFSLHDMRLQGTKSSTLKMQTVLFEYDSYGRSASRPSIGCQLNNSRNTSCCWGISRRYIYASIYIAVKSPAQNLRFCSNYIRFGPMVKWLRHRPFTAVTRVRTSVGSPNNRSMRLLS